MINSAVHTNRIAEKQPDARRVVITPARAAELLKANTSNRKISRRNVTNIAEALKRGEWHYNGESIKIATDNTVIDGQHRLTACIETGIPFETLMVTGLPPAVFAYIDIGKARSGGDTLSTMGYIDATAVAAAVRQIVCLNETGRVAHSKLHVDNAKLASAISAMPNVVAIVEYHRGNRRFGFVATSIAAALHYKMLETSHGEKAVEFFDRLYDGAGLEKNSPILVLRNRLSDNKASKSKLKQYYLAAFIVKAWNAYVAGRSISILRHTPEEEFPQLAQ